MRNSRRYLGARAALLGLTAAALVSCGDDGAVEVRAPVPARLVAVAPMEFSGVVGSEVSPGPTVRVEDKNGSPLGGVAVVFEKPGDESGIPVLTTVESDANGIARLGTWKLGTRAGTHTMTVRVQGISAMTFSAAALPGPAAVMAQVGGDNQTGPAGYTLPTPVRVRVTDSFGNFIQQAEVTFSVQSGAGTIAPSGTTTNAVGEAGAVWRLGETGTNSVVAFVPGLAVVTFTAVAGPPIPPFPGTYVLQSLSNIYGGSPMSAVPSRIVLAADGSFTTYVNDIQGSGTYTVEGTKISLKYAPGFWELMASRMSYYPETGTITPAEETGTIVEGNLTLVRCLSDDCYSIAWTYGRILP